MKYKYYHAGENHLIGRFHIAHFKSLVILISVLVHVFGGPKVNVFGRQQKMAFMIS